MWFLSLLRIMSDKQKRLTSAKSFIHGKRTTGRPFKRSPSEKTIDAMPPTSCYTDLLPSQDVNTIEVNWESPKISQGRQSRVKSTADLLPNLSPTDSNEFPSSSSTLQNSDSGISSLLPLVTPPSCSPLIQIRYRSPLNSQLMSTPVRHQGGREKNVQRRMNSKPSKDDVMQHVINAISSCHNKDLKNQTASDISDPVRIDLVINESTEIRNGITVGHVAAVLSSSLESRSQHSTKDNSLSTVNHITKKDVVAVIAQLDSSTAENDNWTDDEFFLSEAVLEATQATTNICPAIPHSENSRSSSPQCTKRKSKVANMPELGVKKSGRYTFALEDGKTSRTSVRSELPPVSLYKPLFPPPPINRCVVEKAGSLENKELPGDTSLTDELLATIAEPDFFLDSQVDNKLPVDKGCHSLGNESEIVGSTKSRHDENACKFTGIKDEPDVSDMFGDDISDDGLTEQQLMALLDTVESQVTQSIEPVAGALSVTVATTNMSSRFSKGSSTSATANTCQNYVTAEKTTNFGRVASFNTFSTIQRNALRVPLSESKNTQIKNKVSTPCATGNASKSIPTKGNSSPSKTGAVNPVKTGNVSTNSRNMTSSVQSFVRSSEMKERSFISSVTRLNVKSLSSDSIMVPCGTDRNRFGRSSQNQTTGGQSQKYSAAEIEQKKREALRKRELKLKGKQ